LKRYVIAALFALAAHSQAAISLAASNTTGVQSFTTQPAATEWSTTSIGTSASSYTTAAQVDAAAQTLAATAITTQLGLATVPTASGQGKYSGSGATGLIYTAPTGVNAAFVMATLQNDSGSSASTITITYDYTRNGTAQAEEVMGHRVYYSLTGLANSWTVIPALSGISTNQTLTTPVTLSSAWVSGAKLYLLWADDNGSGGPDTGFTIDNFSVMSGIPNTPPVVSITAPTTGSIATAPATVGLSATATDNGSVTQVEFLRDGSVIYTDTTSPYAFSDNGLAAGNYSYTARATDNLGATTTSAAVAVNVFTNPANTALKFDDVDDCVTMGAAPALNAGGPPSNGFTLECWFRKEGAGVVSTSGNGGVSAVPLFGKGRGEGENSNVDCNYFFGITTGGLLAADFEAYPASGITAGQNYPVTATNTPIVNNTWYHAAVTYDGSTTTWKVYLNGVQVGTATAAANALPRYDSIQHFGIGAAFNSTGVREGAFAGTIDEVRVWNYARSAAEILATKDQEITTATTGLLGRYGLNEGTGTSVSNTVGTAGAPLGTLAGGPVWVDGPAYTANVPPTVALTAPADGATVLTGSTVNFAATAADSDGTVSKVEFYQGSTKLGEDSSAPYTVAWIATTAGDFTLTAKAIDNSAASTTSAAVTLHVTQNTAPSVALTAPADNSSLVAPAATTLTASAADSDGSVTKVEFFNGATKLGEDLTSPYSYDWTGMSQGDYVVTAKATDNLGLVTTSAAVILHVTMPATTPPTVAITSPADGANFVFPTTITLTADAADTDGTVAKVEFFNGATKLGEDTSAPYTFTWSGVAIGNYTISAKATDDLTATTTSPAITIHVLANQPPVTTLTAPADNATGIGSSTNLDVSVADPENGAITVTFYGRRTAPAAPGADFTIATLPDTQFYSENLNNNGRAATYLAQTQWLVDNRNSLNLAFVSHMGDIVQNGDAFPAEWAVADNAMKKIESQTATLRAYGIPWGAAPGNHDQTVIGSAGGANSYYNQYFGTSRYAGRNYWGGSQSPANNHNNYQLFSASGLDFIIIHLEYDTRSKASYQTVLDWADALMKAYPDRRAIVTSHWIVNTGNPASFSTQGQDIYNDLKDNPNFFLMLCGHVAGEGQRTDTFQGRAVHSVLQDYQGRTNGGDGWLRYFVFSPANNTISAKTYRVSNPVNPAPGAFGRPQKQILLLCLEKLRILNDRRRDISRQVCSHSGDFDRAEFEAVGLRRSS